MAAVKITTIRPRRHKIAKCLGFFAAGHTYTSTSAGPAIVTADKTPPSDNGHTKPAVTAAKQQATDRLATALRENLHRRKVQARARRQQTARRAASDGLANPNGGDTSEAGS